MLVIPALLTIIAALIILYFTVGKIPQKGLEPSLFRIVADRGKELFSEFDQITLEAPDKLQDKKYLDQFDDKLKILSTGIVVYKGDNLIYASEFLKKPEILDEISNSSFDIRERTRSRTRDRGDMHNPIFVGNKTYNVFGKEFAFSDKTPGKAFLVIDVKPISDFAVKYFSALGYAMIVILILTNGILTYLVSRSILKPLRLLRRGTEQIKEGNLDFEVKAGSRDEIGQLCLAFEEMRKKLKESVELQLQYEENRKELISNISHDLKTPITAIKGYIEGIRDGVADTPEKFDKYVGTIYSKANNMDRLIEDLFLFSKLDLKKLPFNFEKINIKSYFEDCIEELTVDIEKRNVDIILDSSLGSEVQVIADREKLKRVIVNIAENAVKYMGKDTGSIKISLREFGDMIQVCMEDNGQGVDTAELPFIFDRFYRADPARNTSTGGSGLGLAIAKQIIEEHEGKIWAESESGKGTRIFFTLRKA